jgi:hypothetical protein
MSSLAVGKLVFEGRCRVLAQTRHKFRFKNRLPSLDASAIDLCSGPFDWAKCRRTKRAVKLHPLLDNKLWRMIPSVTVLKLLFSVLLTFLAIGRGPFIYTLI